MSDPDGWPTPPPRAVLQADDLDRRRRAARVCHGAATTGGELAWETVAALAVAAGDPDPEVRTYAEGALTALQGEWTEETPRVRALLSAIAADDGDAPLADHAPAGTSVEALSASDPGEDAARARLVERLSRATRTTALTDELPAALDHDDPEVRRALASAAYVTGVWPTGIDREDVEPLFPWTTDPDPGVRAGVTGTVSAAVDDEAVFDVVVERLQDRIPAVRREATRNFHEEFPQRHGLNPGEDRYRRYVDGLVDCAVLPAFGERFDVVEYLRMGAADDRETWRRVMVRAAPGFERGLGSQLDKLVRRAIDVDPAVVEPHVDQLLAPDVAPRDRGAGARLVTALPAAAVPADETATALTTAAVECSMDAARSLDALATLARDYPERVAEDLPLLYRLLGHGDRDVRRAAVGVLDTLAAADDLTLPAPARAVRKADTDPLATVAADHPAFVADRVREVVEAVRADPSLRTNSRWSPRVLEQIAAVDPTLFDGAVDPIESALEAGGDAARAVAWSVWRAGEAADLAPIADGLRQAIARGPRETPPEVVRLVARLAASRPGLVVETLEDVVEWLTWHAGRSAAARVVTAIDEYADVRLPPVADAVAEHPGWPDPAQSGDSGHPDEDTDRIAPERAVLRALADRTPERAMAALDGIVDRFVADGTGTARDVVDAIVEARAGDPEVAIRALDRLDDRLDRHGSRVEVGDVLADHGEEAHDDLAGAGLGLLLAALDHSRPQYKQRVAAILERGAAADPDRAATHAGDLVARLDDTFAGSAARAGLEQGIAADPATAAQSLAAGIEAGAVPTTALPEGVEMLVDADPDQGTLDPLVTAIRGRLLRWVDQPTGHGRDPDTQAFAAVVSTLYERRLALAETLVRPVALAAAAEVAEGEFDPSKPLRSLIAVERLAPGLVTYEDGSPAVLDGLTVVVTGAVEGHTREEIQAIVDRHGGRTVSSVSGRTDLLLVGSQPGQSKREAARQEGVPMVRTDAIAW